VGSERVSTNLPSSHGDHEDDRGVNASTQRRPMPVCPRERSGQPSKQRHSPDWIDRRPKSRKILADFNEKRRHVNGAEGSAT
jgi:hypothetical protein